MDRSIFFAGVRRSLFGGRLSPKSVAGMTAILDAWDESGLADRRWLAYGLATALGEVGVGMTPIPEVGRGKGKPYGVKTQYGGQVAYGRGLVQLTWQSGYERADAELGLNGALLKNFDLALEPKIAGLIMWRGMSEGWFTTKKFDDYFHGSQSDWKGARKIINGTDKAAMFAGYGQSFHAAIETANAAAA